MPVTAGVPSSFSSSHIISGSVPARRWRPVASSNSAWMRLRFPRQSEVRNAAGSSRSSRLRKQLHQTRATFGSHGSGWKVSGSGTPTSSAASGPYPM